MNIHRLLVGLSIVLTCVLVVLISLLVIRRQRLQTQETAVTTSTSEGKVEVSQTELTRLQQIAERDPYAAVEGIRSPTPIPQDTLTIKETGAEPPFIHLKGTHLNVINRLKRDLFIFRKNIIDGKVDQLGTVTANGQTSLLVVSENLIGNPPFQILISNSQENPEDTPPIMQVDLRLER
jgi:hypothetical protein